MFVQTAPCCGSGPGRWHRTGKMDNLLIISVISSIHETLIGFLLSDETL